MIVGWSSFRGNMSHTRLLKEARGLLLLTKSNTPPIQQGRLNPVAGGAITALSSRKMRKGLKDALFWRKVVRCNFRFKVTLSVCPVTERLLLRLSATAQRDSRSPVQVETCSVNITDLEVFTLDPDRPIVSDSDFGFCLAHIGNCI